MLVIDTGVDLPRSPFRTPQTEAMLWERHRPIDGARASEFAKYENSEGTIGGRVDGYDPAKKGLRLEVTMEDPKVLTSLDGVVTYLPAHWLAGIHLRRQPVEIQGRWIGS